MIPSGTDFKTLLGSIRSFDCNLQVLSIRFAQVFDRKILKPETNHLLAVIEYLKSRNYNPIIEKYFICNLNVNIYKTYYNL